MATASATRLRAALAPLVTGLGADLEDVEVRAAGRRTLVRVVVDRDGGVDLDAVAEISRAIGDHLEEQDLMGSGPYVLEVTSPGVDRPLTQPRHWRRARGRLVACSLTTGERLTGRVVSASDAAVVLDVAGAGARELDYGDIARAVVEVEFGRADEDPEEA
jgi:ribosome maturation factor RimP